MSDRKCFPFLKSINLLCVAGPVRLQGGQFPAGNGCCNFCEQMRECSPERSGLLRVERWPAFLGAAHCAQSSDQRPLSVDAVCTLLIV